AERTGDALVLLIGEEVAEGVRALQPRRTHLDLLQRHRRPHIAAEAEPRPYPRRRLDQLRRAGRLVLVTPTPVLEAPLGHATPDPPPGVGIPGGAGAVPPLSTGPCRGAPRFCLSPPASRGRACRPC